MITRNRFVDIIISISSYVSIVFTIASLVLGITVLVMIHFYSNMNPENYSEKMFTTICLMGTMSLPFIFNFILIFFLPTIPEEEKKMLTKKELHKKHENVALFGKKYFLIISNVIHVISYVLHIIFFSVFLYLIINQPGTLQSVQSSSHRIQYETQNKCCIRYGEIGSSKVFSDCPLIDSNATKIDMTSKCEKEDSFYICEIETVELSFSDLCDTCVVEDLIYTIFMAVLALLSHFHYLFVIIGLIIAWFLQPGSIVNDFLNNQSIDMKEGS